MTDTQRSGAGPAGAAPFATTGVPRLGRGVKFRYDRARERHVLLLPETVVVLNATGTAILELCDGVRTVADIVEALREQYGDVPEGQVVAYLAKLAERRHLEITDGD